MTGCVVDIGATRHICSNNKLFLNYEEVINEENAYLEDSDTARVTEKRKVLLKLTSSKSLALHTVLHIPKICKNLWGNKLNWSNEALFWNQPKELSIVDWEEICKSFGSVDFVVKE